MKTLKARALDNKNVLEKQKHGEPFYTQFDMVVRLCVDLCQKAATRSASFARLPSYSRHGAEFLHTQVSLFKSPTLLGQETCYFLLTCLRI